MKELLYITFRGSKATVYATLMEDKSIEEYTKHQQNNHGLTTELFGLVVILIHYLAASPDGVVHDPTAISPMGLVEYQNPSLQHHLILLKLAQTKPFTWRNSKMLVHSLFTQKRA